jgi:hypothetical protein
MDIHRTVSRLFFFSPSFDETTTKLHLHAEKITETVLHLNLGYFVVFCLGFFPFDETMTDYFRDTISRIGGSGTNTKIMKTELYCI